MIDWYIGLRTETTPEHLDQEDGRFWLNEYVKQAGHNGPVGRNR